MDGWIAAAAPSTSAAAAAIASPSLSLPLLPHFPFLGHFQSRRRCSSSSFARSLVAFTFVAAVVADGDLLSLSLSLSSRQ